MGMRGYSPRKAAGKVKNKVIKKIGDEYVAE